MSVFWPKKGPQRVTEQQHDAYDAAVRKHVNPADIKKVQREYRHGVTRKLKEERAAEARVRRRKGQ